MQAINIYSNKLFFKVLILFIIGNIVFVSCKEDEPGPPVITQVRLTDPAKADSTFTQADPGTLIVIQGENLGGLLHVYFNNYEASFNSVFTTETNVIVRIPEEAPTEVIDPDVPHEIRIVTNHGEGTYTFSLTPPPPEINYISNENALPGKDIIIGGTNFYLLEKIIFPGNIGTSDFTVSSTAKLILVTVPEGLTETGKIMIVTPYDTIESPMLFNDVSGENIICNFDDINVWENWGGTVIDTDTSTLLPQFRGNAFLVNVHNIPTGAWWNQDMVIPIISGLYPRLGHIGSVESIFVKFEMYVKGPWNSGYYRVTLVHRETGVDLNGNGELYDWLSTYYYDLKLWDTGDDENRLDYETEDWITISIPLSLFKNDGSQAIIDFADIEEYNFFGCYFTNPAGANDVPIPSFIFGMDNIRMFGY